MTHRRNHLLTVLVASAALAGCASTSELDSVRAAADQAVAEAAEAKRMALEAEREAAAAKLAAEQAISEATAARAKSEDTEAKIDRMFKKAMYK